jgi:hypothetical protein
LKSNTSSEKQGHVFKICKFLVSGLQRFSEQPKYTEVNPNQDALLVCKVLDRRGSCSWQKDNKPVGMYPKKYEWASTNSMGIHSHSGGDCSIWVRSATLEFDDGNGAELKSLFFGEKLLNFSRIMGMSSYRVRFHSTRCFD